MLEEIGFPQAEQNVRDAELLQHGVSCITTKGDIDVIDDMGNCE